MPMRSWKIVLWLGGVALALAVLRYFTKGWLEPLGVPVALGSLVASVTVILLFAVWTLFSREGRLPGGRYLRAATKYAALAAWCEILVIAGILLTERSGADTYYRGPWEKVMETFPAPAAHAVGHTQGFLVRLAFGLLLGAAVYALVKRTRSQAGT